MPGVRLNFSKNTVGMSFGVPGARYTINSKGRKTLSTGIPGTGIYNVETLSSGSRDTGKMMLDDSAEQNVVQNRVPPSPGFFARKAERELNSFLHDIYDLEDTDAASSVIEKAVALRKKYDELRYSLELISFLHGITDEKWEKQAAAWGAGLWEYRELVFNDKYVRKYFSGIKPSVHISQGITTQLHFGEQTLGFIWVEVLQGQKKFQEALEVLNLMQPDQMVAISLADLEISSGDFDGAIETTEDVEVFDDATAMLLVLRGVAFRGKGMHEASIECFKRALKDRKIPETLKHRALFERGISYASLGKKAMAIKDLEKILVDDPDYPEVEKKLNDLKK